MTRNETHVHDISTLANFKDWAMSIGAALSAFGWTKSTDTGQVDWSSIASVPASNTYVYEIWQPGDGGTAFYVRIDYGNSGGSPALRIQGATTTNGAGTLSGFTTTQAVPVPGANSGSTLFNCLYCGDTSSFAIMMWRDIGTSSNFVISVDRARNSAGATTNSYFTLLCSLTTSNNAWFVQSLWFGVGAAPAQGSQNISAWNCLFGASNFRGASQSMAFNGNTGITPVFPFVGYYDCPVLTVAHAAITDFSELAVISTTVLGASHTYIFAKGGTFGGSNFGLGVLMRWE